MRLPDPMNAMSLLTLHDAVELFLALAAEHFGENSKTTSFMSYWELLRPHLQHDLSQKQPMQRLNRARVAFKHHGTLPNKTDIEGYRYTAQSFFEDNTPLVFSVAFDSVSMVSLVNSDKARGCLEQADQFAESQQWTEATSQTALAFHYMLADYEDAKSSPLGWSPFSMGPSMRFNTATHMQIHDQHWQRFINDTSQAITSLQTVVKLFIFGVDYRRYTVFKMLTPYVVVTMGGINLETSEQFTPTKEDYRFCQQFVIESALAIQDFDFNMESIAPRGFKPVL